MTKRKKTVPTPQAVLLDTCAVTWLANGDSMAADVLAAISHAALADGILSLPLPRGKLGC